MSYKFIQSCDFQLLLLVSQQSGLDEMHPPKFKWFCCLGKKEEYYITVLQSFGWLNVVIANVRGEKKEWEKHFTLKREKIAIR